MLDKGDKLIIQTSYGGSLETSVDVFRNRIAGFEDFIRKQKLTQDYLNKYVTS